MSKLKVKNPNSEFGTVEKVQAAIFNCQQIEDRRALDRARINVLFNGGRPYSAEEEAKYQIAVNVNFGQGKKIMMDAKRQTNNATIHQGTLFTCSTDSGPVDKRDEWGQIFTTEIHKPLQQGRSGKQNFFLINNRNAALCMHGIGPMFWPTDFKWMPRFLPLEDLLIPTDTYCDFSNLRYFSVNLYLSPGEFIKMTQGDMVQKGWNVAACRKILDAQKDNVSESTPTSWRDQPEAMREVFKQNQGYYYSDAIPKIRLRAFYFQQVDDPKKWYRRILPRETYTDVNANVFLYDSDEVFADDVDHILNVQYGDLSLVSPQKYHSVKGLGVDLYSPVEITNRLQCEFVQSCFEHLKMYFKINNPADRDRLKQIVLQQFGFIPEGLSIVPRNDRHQIDPGMVQLVLAQMRQYMQENSASFVQDTADVSGKEMTAKEAMIRLNQANMLIGSMLGSLYTQEGFYYEELKRRFLKKDSLDPQVKAFQGRCIARGIPKDMLEPERWHVVPERVLGGGDQSLAEMQANWLYQNRASYGPEAQQKILFITTSTILRDPAKARNLVPQTPTTSTKGSEMAEMLYGTLMDGIECSMRQGIDYEGYVMKLLISNQAVISRIQQTGNMATMQEVLGLANVVKNASEYIAVIEQDPAKKQLVKQMQDMVGQQLNELKGYMQRLQEQQNESQNDPETMAKIQGMILQAQTKAKISEAQAMQKLQHKQAAFDQKQRQSLVSHTAKTIGEAAKTEQDIHLSRARTAADIQNERIRAEKEPARNGE